MSLNPTENTISSMELSLFSRRNLALFIRSARTYSLNAVVPEMFSEEFQVQYLQAMNDVLDRYGFVAGEHPWNFADFDTQQGPMRAGGNHKGLFDRNRCPKMAAHYLRHRWHGLAKNTPNNQ